MGDIVKKIKLENILLIGNGFDRAHGYPTSYLEFAEYVETLLNLRKNECIMKSNGLHCTEKPKYDFIDWFLFSFEEYCDEFCSLVENNIWMSLFNEKYHELRVGEYWYDLEKIIKDEINNPNSSMISNSEKCIKDFNRFRRAFEVFIYFFVEFAENRNRKSNISERVKTHMEEIAPVYIINYNYSNTYSKLYNKNIEVDFLHGKAKCVGEINDCNIVFGCNEITLDARKEIFKIFTKTYQCESFNIVPQYKKWVDNQKYNLHIYGHSLDETDKDTLYEIMIHPNIAEVHIWTFNEEEFKGKKKSLKKILGKEYNILEPRIYKENI